MLHALFLGLSAAPFCLAYCAPVLFPLTCARGERTITSSLRRLGAFFMGRLIGYVAFGMIVGILGDKMESPWATRVSAVAMATLSVMLVVEGLRAQKLSCGGSCQTFQGIYSRFQPALLGLASGISLCPPFLVAIAYVFGAGGPLKGATFFAFYFLGTIIFQVPVAFAGPTGGRKAVRLTSQVTALVAGVMFLGTATVMLFQ